MIDQDLRDAVADLVTAKKTTDCLLKEFIEQEGDMAEKRKKCRAK